ncbi:hypothetical protein VaNZ11_001215 [Volvox africanus]|uniref:Uncharacterized protein n=1 Tax=Volvox africanus TaxID=51714 RepID=A0ABQ5RP79_9CHLO|nr:hypothetical protein VaNZ11_001215 [Volvox africanus]
MSSVTMSNGGLCCGSGPDSPTDDTDDILFIGLQGSGKTLLGQRLRTVYGKASTAFRLATTETNGSQDFRIPTFKGCPFKEIRIRECGGSMQPLWGNWYSQPIKGVVFTLDVSDPTALAAGGMELQRVLQQPELSSKPICLALTKVDLPFTVPRAELDLALGLSDLEDLYPSRLRITAISSMRSPDECPELEALVDWMIEVKAGDQAVLLAKRK